MEAKFSESVKNIIQFARHEALILGTPAIEPQHLVLGLLRAQKPLTLTQLVLENLKINVAKLEKSLIVSLNEKKSSATSEKSIPLTKTSEKILKIAYLEAKIFRSDVITTLHVLLSILRDDESETSLVLKKFNITYELIKSEVKYVQDRLELEPYPTYTLDNQLADETPVNPISLIFDTDEYSRDEIKSIIELLSDLYSNIGGDYLKVSGMNQFEHLVNLDIA